MSREIDVLLSRVEDPSLRADLRTQFDRAASKRRFGLVFEDHLPERVRLPDHPIRSGVNVVPRADPDDNDIRHVTRVRNGKATLLAGDETTEQVAVDELVVVAEFGQTIHPGLRHLGSVHRGGNKPAHVVIKGENHHALELLQFTQAGKVDCIYIDPPYNNGTTHWKYGNKFVDENDAYRHSKWLAFMARRLRLAKQLLDPEDSALIVAIDENEVHRLGLLIEQIFPGARTRMISTLINPKGVGVSEGFKRVDEYLFIVRLGEQQVVASTDVPLGSKPVGADGPKKAVNDADDDEELDTPAVGLDWRTARRRDLDSVRRTRPRQFYPIYVNEVTGRIEAVGEPIPHDMDRNDAPTRPGCVSVFPVRDDGTEMNWGVTAPTFIERWEKGFCRAGKAQPGKPQPYKIQYLKAGPIADIEEGRAVVDGYADDGSVIGHYDEAGAKATPSQWNMRSHNAEHYGTKVVRSLLPGRSFPYPKSLYAVEDVLRLMVSRKPEAVILDFFAGSGTTAHAVARLNRQDGGRRQSISVTNNEISADEEKQLRKEGLLPGDPGWEALGIFEHVTRPRIEAAVTGVTPDGEPVKGDYKFTDEFPMAEGFEENVEFFELTYLDPEDVELDLAFEGIAPLLWMRAGCAGPILASRTDSKRRPVPYLVTDRYGVLFDTDRWRRFVDAMPASAAAGFVVTDSASVFAGVAAELPGSLDLVRLYENYLSTFAINQGR